MNNINSPWEGMVESSQRRVFADTDYHVFWITDLEGNYGFSVQTQAMFNDAGTVISLKGISVLKRNLQNGYGELILILNNKDDFQIFQILCEDLISEIRIYNTPDRMIKAVESRLSRWQKLLMLENRNEMTIETQMGLFSELLCLKDIVIPQLGISQAIVSWVGPDFDRQDFLIDNSTIEVKSYKTSKGPVVAISSINQLYCEKKYLFLISYGLTISENGLSVYDMSQIIHDLLEESSNELSLLFDQKLLTYGYIPELTKVPLKKFIVDTTLAFNVTNNFPKINATNIKPQISNIKYSVDLSQCLEFKIDLQSMKLKDSAND